jgi:hypothetical protein
MQVVGTNVAQKSCEALALASYALDSEQRVSYLFSTMTLFGWRPYFSAFTDKQLTVSSLLFSKICKSKTEQVFRTPVRPSRVWSTKREFLFSLSTVVNISDFLVARPQNDFFELGSQKPPSKKIYATNRSTASLNSSTITVSPVQPKKGNR